MREARQLPSWELELLVAASEERRKETNDAPIRSRVTEADMDPTKPPEWFGLLDGED